MVNVVFDNFNDDPATSQIEIRPSTSGHTWTKATSSFMGAWNGYAYKQASNSVDACYYLGIGLDFHNVSLQAQIIVLEDQSNGLDTDGWALRFRRSDENNWWEWGMDPNTGYYILRKMVAGDLYIVDEPGVQWAEGDILKVECYEERINCYVNQRLHVSVTDTELMTNQHIGLRASGPMVDGRLDNFSGVELVEDIRQDATYYPSYEILVDWDKDGGLNFGDFESTDTLDGWIPFGTRTPDMSITDFRVRSGFHSLLVSWNNWNLLQFDVSGHGFDQGQFGGDEWSNPPNPFKFNQAGQGFDDGRFANIKVDLNPDINSIVTPGFYKLLTNLVPGRVYTLRTWVYVPTGSTAVSFGISGIATPTVSTQNDQWERLEYTYTATATSHAVVFLPSGTTNPDTGDLLYVDEVMNIGQYEDITCYVMGERQELNFQSGRDQARSLASVSPAQIDMELDNSSGIFSPDNPGSVLAGYLEPGRYAVVRAEYNNRIVGLFYGFVDNYILNPNPEDQSVTFSCIDALQYLANAKISTQLYPSIQTGQAVNVILDTVGWPQEKRQIESGATTVKWWHVEGDDGLTAVQDLVKAEGIPAAAYVDQFGNFVFCDRHHRLTTANSKNIQATFRACSDFDEPVFSGPIDFDIGWKDIINQIDVEVEERTLKDMDTVWEQEDLLIIPANTSITVKVKASNAFYNAQPLTVGFEDITEFDADIGKDITLKTGSGQPASVVLSRTSGQSLDIVITAGASQVSISRIRLRAMGIDTLDPSKVFDENADSVAKYGPKATDGDYQWVNANDMAAIASITLGHRSERLPVVHIKVANGHPIRISNILETKLHDRIHIVEMLQTFMNDDYIVETLEHTIAQNGASHVLTIGCEKARDQQLVTEEENPLPQFTFDVAGQGFNDGYFLSGGEGLSLSNNLFILDQSKLNEDGLGF